MLKHSIILKAPITPSEDWYYQAIGDLFTLVTFVKEGSKIKFFVELDQKKYGLVFKKDVKGLMLRMALLQQLKKHPEKSIWLRCYPQYSPKTKTFYFCLLYFNEQQPENAKHGIFLLKGVWQTVPCFAQNYFTIYRNQKNAQETPKNQYLPLIWHKNPWKFNPKSSNKPKFSVILAQFTNNQLTHFKTISESPEIPPKITRYRKKKNNLHEQTRQNLSRNTTNKKQTRPLQKVK